MSNLIELAERCERASPAHGPLDLLDAHIVAALNNATLRPYPPTDDFGPRNRWQFWSKDGAHFLGNEGKFPVAALTTSLDAAVALCERVLPGWDWQIERLVSFDGPYALVELGDRPQVEAATPALALVAATLRALAARQPEETGRDGS